MLDAKTIATVKSTLPLLTKTGPALTAHFYQRMFSHNPELKDIFNMSNQRNGDQREALFNVICAYAANIDNLSSLLPAVERIAQKHTSFSILPAQYGIVGKHLLATLDELFSPGEEILAAWGKAYGVLAEVFIQRERAIYQDSTNQPGGWEGTRPFRIVNKQAQSALIASFTLEPVDGKPVVDFKPGQYLAVYIRHNSLTHQEIRQYSLTHAPNGRTYRIAVKREQQGTVSSYLHDIAQEGDIISLAAPHGDFCLSASPTTPVTLISAGVGQTPLLSMLHQLKEQTHEADILWLHAADNGDVHAFGDELAQINQQWPTLMRYVWYRQPGKNDRPGEDFHYQGVMLLDKLAYRLTNSCMHFYLCGPVAFMQFVAQQLLAVGIAPSQLHYECFGPHKVV